MDNQNFLTDFRKIFCVACFEISIHKYENYVFD